MHISEGVLSAPVLVTGALLTAAGTALGLKKMDYEKIPEVLFSIVIGGRLDDYSLYGTELNPKASLMWEITDKTRLRVSAGRAFKSPTIRQLYVFFKHGTWWNRPNENLNPETSWGYSADLNMHFQRNCLQVWVHSEMI